MASSQVALASCALVLCDVNLAYDADLVSRVDLAAIVYDGTRQLVWEWRTAHVCYTRSSSLKYNL